MSTTTGWVQTHCLTAYANNLGWCKFNDVLGAGRHYVSLFADMNYQKGLGVVESSVSIDDVQVPAQVTDMYGYNIYWFDVSGQGNQHSVMQHVNVALDPPGQGSQVFICVYQYRTDDTAGGEFDLVSPIRPAVPTYTQPVADAYESEYHESEGGCCVIA